MEFTAPSIYDIKNTVMFTAFKNRCVSINIYINMTEIFLHYNLDPNSIPDQRVQCPRKQ